MKAKSINLKYLLNLVKGLEYDLDTNTFTFKGKSYIIKSKTAIFLIIKPKGFR